VIEKAEGTPMLTIVVPETDEDDPKSVSIWHYDGLRNLAAQLHEALDEFDNEEVSENPLDKENGTA
jgi:hypothetical protein